MQAFMKEYIHGHDRLNQAVRKLMRHYAGKSVRLLRTQKSIPDFVEIEDFAIPEDFRIDGCYV